MWKVWKKRVKRNMKGMVSRILIPFRTTLVHFVRVSYALEIATKSKLRRTWCESQKIFFSIYLTCYVECGKISSLAIHCIICIFKLITRHWSNARKLNVRGAMLKKNKHIRNKSQQNKVIRGAEHRCCIAYEILMWCQKPGERIIQS